MLRICATFVLLLFAPPLWAAPHGTVRVIDGDTWDVGDVRVRLHGIDAPEIGQTCTTEQGVVWPCGAWVRNYTAAAYEGRSAQCETLDQDRYGRSVARCFIDGQDVAQDMVANGLALVYRRYSIDYVAAQAGAAARDLGLHSSVFQTPARHRTTRIRGRIPPDPACSIKGNISANGRIFHLPGQANYARTGIRPDKGERWFCSIQQARSAGWRAAKR